MIWDSLAVEVIEEYREACVYLLTYYEGNADRDLADRIAAVCPLCKAGPPDCQYCPWEVLGGTWCLAWADDAGYSDFCSDCRETLAVLRIPMLKEWLVKIDEYLAKRGE